MRADARTRRASGAAGAAAGRALAPCAAATRERGALDDARRRDARGARGARRGARPARAARRARRAPRPRSASCCAATATSTSICRRCARRACRSSSGATRTTTGAARSSRPRRWCAACSIPHDHLALLTALRSSAVGVPDAALIPLWRQAFPDARTASSAVPIRRSALASCARPRYARRPRACRATCPASSASPGWEKSLARRRRGARTRCARSFETEPAERLRRAPARALAARGQRGGAAISAPSAWRTSTASSASSSPRSRTAAATRGRRSRALRRASAEAREPRRGARGTAPRTRSRCSRSTAPRASTSSTSTCSARIVATGATDPRRTAVVRRGSEVGFVLLGAPSPA